MQLNYWDIASALQLLRDCVWVGTEYAHLKVASHLGIATLHKSNMKFICFCKMMAYAFQESLFDQDRVKVWLGTLQRKVPRTKAVS